MVKQSGTSLIEILVTILVVSLGLLGVAGIVGNGLKDSHSSYGRSQASMLAADIVDRMRANRILAETIAQPYDLSLSSTTPVGGSGSIPDNDLNAWRNALSSTLPNGTGSVLMDPATKKVHVEVRCDDSRATGGSANQTFVLETRL